MTRQKNCKHRGAVNRSAGRRVVGDGVERAMRELEAVTRDNLGQADPIVEQLKQCQEAFKAGEMISKMLDSLKYTQDKDAVGNRCLPPAGAVIPPLA
jgi:hypothetical protein